MPAPCDDDDSESDKKKSCEDTYNDIDNSTQILVTEQKILTSDQVLSKYLD